MKINVKEFELLNVSGKKIGLTSGCFDLFHYYHLTYLQQCKERCDMLIVGVDSDFLVKSQKKKEPVVNQFHRLEIINALSCVDVCYIQDSLETFRFFSDKSSVIFKNSHTIYGAPLIGAHKTVIIPDLVEIYSSTELKQKIHDQYTEQNIERPSDLRR